MSIVRLAVVSSFVLFILVSACNKSTLIRCSASFSNERASETGARRNDVYARNARNGRRSGKPGDPA